jgi:hypothetical protein
MDPKLLTKFAESPAELTTAEIDALAEMGEGIRAVAIGRRAAAIAKAAPPPSPMERMAAALVEMLKRVMAPRDARLDALERDLAELRARTLELEGAAATREVPAR